MFEKKEIKEMNSVAEIGGARLEKVLLKDKKQNPKLILELVKSEIATLLENYMELVEVNADIEFEGGFYELKVSAKARQIKTIGMLKF